jgi:hypothetical protein
MDFNNLDLIFLYIKNEQYDMLEKFDNNEINIVLNLKFNNKLKQEEIIKYNLVKRRDRQGNFREKIIDRDNCCILSKKDYSLCEAAHILNFKDSDEDAKYDIFNGILLSCNLHKAFDSNFFTFDSDTCKFKILYKNLVSKNIDQLGIKEYEGRYIKQLDNLKSKLYLKKRNKIELKF